MLFIQFSAFLHKCGVLFISVLFGWYLSFEDLWSTWYFSQGESLSFGVVRGSIFKGERAIPIPTYFCAFLQRGEE